MVYRRTRRSVRGFTLLDVMIVVVILGILASIVVPIVAGHLKTSEETAATSTFAMVRKALDMHFQKHDRWPDTIENKLFVNGQPVKMPKGYQLVYNPSSGALDLNELPKDEAEDAPAVLIDDGGGD